MKTWYLTCLRFVQIPTELIWWSVAQWWSANCNEVFTVVCCKNYTYHLSCISSILSRGQTLSLPFCPSLGSLSFPFLSVPPISLSSLPGGLGWRSLWIGSEVLPRKFFEIKLQFGTFWQRICGHPVSMFMNSLSTLRGHGKLPCPHKYTTGSSNNVMCCTLQRVSTVLCCC